MESLLKVVVTGASSEIGRTLSYFVAKGDVFGADRLMELVLVDNHSKMNTLRRDTAVELGMCNLHLVRKTTCTSSLDLAFKDADAIFLAGGTLPAPGLSRNDIISINALEYKAVGLALEKQILKPTLKILLVAEPQNINLIVLSYFAPTLKKKCITGLSRVDHNRAATMIARMLGIANDKVRHLTMWGNRSKNIFPDVRHAKVEVCGKVLPAYDAIKDDFYLKYKFTEHLHGRAAEIYRKRKTGAFMPVAVAAMQHMRDWVNGTKPGEWTSMVVISDGSYGIEKGLAYSFPVHVLTPGKWEIVPDLDINYYEREKFAEQVEEIQEEKMFAFTVLELRQEKKEEEEDQGKPLPWSFGAGEIIPCSILGPLEQERLGAL